MAAIRFYTDEHVSKAVVKGLRERGVDVSTVAEAALVGAPDDGQLVHARREGRVLFTHDADFLRLHAKGSEHAGTSSSCDRLDQQRPPGVAARRLTRLAAGGGRCDHEPPAAEAYPLGRWADRRSGP